MFVDVAPIERNTSASGRSFLPWVVSTLFQEILMNMEDRTKLLIVKTHGREKYAIRMLKLGRSALKEEIHRLCHTIVTDSSLEGSLSDTEALPPPPLCGCHGEQHQYIAGSGRRFVDRGSCIPLDDTCSNRLLARKLELIFRHSLGHMSGKKVITTETLQPSKGSQIDRLRWRGEDQCFSRLASSRQYTKILKHNVIITATTLKHGIVEASTSPETVRGWDLVWSSAR